jgi:CDP-glucose 4,6-dehydratase
MHYLLTGHTGFKGAWLALMLVQQGHTVSGLALDPAKGSLYERARVSELLSFDLRVDIRDKDATADAVRTIRPEVVIHLAAQALVRRSYEDPRCTYETNTLGTFNVLQALEKAPKVKALVVVTTDKVYRNENQRLGYQESDPLGGVDPYSTSKAAADLIAQSWIKTAGLGVPTAIARAGNVIGGGDVCSDRLMVDLVAALSAGESIRVRSPQSVRPWQHVLDCLHGYLMLTDALLVGKTSGEAFSFGPDADSFVRVGTVVENVAKLWGTDLQLTHGSGPDGGEAALLALDTRKAELELNWRTKLSLHESLAWTVEWEKRVLEGGNPRAISVAQIISFMDRCDRRPNASSCSSVRDPAQT